MNKIVIIGAGNVAWNLAHTLPFCGCAVTQIVSRTKHAAQTLAMGTGADFTANFAQISSDADFYIYAVRDDALNAVIEQVRVNSGIHIHTSGAVDMSVFKRKKDNYGVFYPYQTFTKNKLVDFKQTPIFIEANSEKNLEIIYNFSKNISNKIFKINSLQRKQAHIAGVFACNFTNCLYSVAYDLLHENGLPFEIILPMINENVQKLHFLSPKEAQTGPAARGDKKIIAQHQKILADKPDLREIYRLISEKITAL